MSEQTHRLRLPGELAKVRAACDFVVGVAEKAGLDENNVFQCQLSVEEIFTNIVEHGYGHAGAEKHIEIVCTFDDETLTIAILDDAPHFNPLELDDPDPETPLWERKNGGWGVYFVQQYMDDIRYQLADGRNCLTLVKSLA